jgi:hypothetical protein
MLDYDFKQIPVGEQRSDIKPSGRSIPLNRAQLAIGKPHDALRSRRLDDEPDFVAGFETGWRLKRPHVADAAQETGPKRLRPIGRHGRPGRRGEVVACCFETPVAPSDKSRHRLELPRTTETNGM